MWGKGRSDWVRRGKLLTFKRSSDRRVNLKGRQLSAFLRLRPRTTCAFCAGAAAIFGEVGFAAESDARAFDTSSSYQQPITNNQDPSTRHRSEGRRAYVLWQTTLELTSDLLEQT
jgi:hypothetical protein